MDFLQRLFSVVNKALVGTTVSQMDSPYKSGWSRMSFRIIWRGGDPSQPYVELVAGGNGEVYEMETDEFVQFANTAQAMKNELLRVNQQSIAWLRRNDR